MRAKDQKLDEGKQWEQLARRLTATLKSPTNILQLWFLCSQIDDAVIKATWVNMLLTMFRESGILYWLVCEQPVGTAKISYNRAEKAYTADGFRFLQFAPLMLQAKDVRLEGGELKVVSEEWRDLYVYYATDMDSAIKRSRPPARRLARVRLAPELGPSRS